MPVQSGMNINSNGYLRFHRPPELKDKYGHRVYANRQLQRTYHRDLRPDEEVHHACGNRLCWPPSDFHLVIMSQALHDAMAGGKRYRRKKR